MNFPEQTIDLASSIATEIRTKYGNEPLELAKGLYLYLNDKFSAYGFNEGLKQGYYIRWPHEIKTEWECIETATYVYAVAEALNLEPRMMSMSTWRTIDTGHETVDVKCGRSRVLIDPLNDMFGVVNYNDDSIVVEDNDVTERCMMESGDLKEVSRDILIARIDYYRSDEGIVNLLTCGQSLNYSPLHRVFLQYLPNEMVLEFQLRTEPPFITPSYFSEKWFFLPEKETVQQSFEQGIFRESKWAELIGKEAFWRIPPGSEDEIQKFPLTDFGKGHLMSHVLYGNLVEEEASTEEYLFKYRDLPLDGLKARIDDITVTPETKGDYYDIKGAYDSIIAQRKKRPESMERILDYASFMLLIEASAQEKGCERIDVLRERLRIFHIDEAEIEQKRMYNPFGGSGDIDPVEMMDSVFPKKEMKSLFERLLEKGLIN